MECMYDFTYVKDDCTNDKEWVVLIHGIGGNSSMWRRQIALLQDDYNTCAITLPGHGFNNSNVVNMGAETFEQVALGIIRYLHTKGIKEIYLISVSMGTIVANEMLKLDPAFIKKSLLTGAVCGVNTIMFWECQLVVRCADFIPYRALVSLCVHVLLPKSTHKKSRTFLIQECLKMSKEELVKWIFLLFKNMNYLKNRTLDSAKCLLVVGDEDYAFRGGNISIARRCKLPIHVMKHCGHVVSLHRWREFNQVMMNVLKNDAIPKEFNILPTAK